MNWLLHLISGKRGEILVIGIYRAQLTTGLINASNGTEKCENNTSYSQTQGGLIKLDNCFESYPTTIINKIVSCYSFTQIMDFDKNNQLVFNLD